MAFIPQRLRGAWLDNLRDYATQVGEDDLSGAAAELAFRFFLALFPFLIFLAALGNFAADLFNVANPSQEVIDAIGESLPQDSAAVLTRQIESVLDNRNSGLVSLGFGAAIWAASGGTGAFMKSMNRVYDVRETRPIWLKYGVAVSLTLFGGAFLLLAVIFFILGEGFSRDFADALGLSSFSGDLIYVARWPATIAVILAATAVLYWAAPAVKRPFRPVTFGSLFFAAGWLLASFLFGLYVANFGSYNATYGSLGALVAALMWAYLSSFLLLAGAEIDAMRFQRAQRLPAQLPAETAAAGQAPADFRPTPKRSALSLGFVTMLLAGGFWLSSRKDRRKGD